MENVVELIPLEPRPGEIVCREWWTQEGKINIRHVLIVAALRPHPYVVRIFAGRGKQPPRVKRYGAWMKSTREQIRFALMASGIEPFSKDWILGTAMSSAAPPEAPADARIRKDGRVDGRYIKSVLSWDRTDLDKAIEDSCNGILWHDDNQVRTTGPGTHFAQTGNAFAIHAWGTQGNYVPWNPEWDAEGFSVPFSYTWLSVV
jgi:hypothetical protein